MSKNLFQTSVFVAFLRMPYRSYDYLERGVGKLYRESKVRALICALSKRITAYFRYSFLCRITEINDGVNLSILNDSDVAHKIISLYSNLKGKAASYSKRSSIIIALEGFKNEFYRIPLKLIGILIVSVIVVNLFLLIIFRIEISFFGWLARGLIFFVGICGLFSNISLQALSGNSKFLRRGVQK